MDTGEGRGGHGMTIYILWAFIWLTSGAGGAATAEYDSRQACEQAAQTLVQTWPGYKTLTWACTPKGDTG